MIRNFMQPDAAEDQRLTPQLWLLLGLVALDVLSKLAACRLLPSEPGAYSESEFQWQLSINPVGLGGAGRNLLGGRGVNVVLIGAVLCAALACALLVLALTRRLTASSVAVASGVAVVSAPVLMRLVCLVDVSPHASVVLLRGAQVALWWLVWMRLHRPLWKLGAMPFAAAATGNFLSFLYSPFAVVDFVWSPPLHRAIGLGVFNLADILWHLGIATFVFASILRVPRRQDGTAYLAGKAQTGAVSAAVTGEPWPTGT